jgi:hypothetical protein
MFLDARTSADAERAHLHARRTRDEFWYAERFGLNWPRLAGLPGESAAGGFQTPVSPDSRPAAADSATPSQPPENSTVDMDPEKSSDASPDAQRLAKALGDTNVKNTLVKAAQGTGMTDPERGGVITQNTKTGGYQAVEETRNNPPENFQPWFLKDGANKYLPVRPNPGTLNVDNYPPGTPVEPDTSAPIIGTWHTHPSGAGGGRYPTAQDGKSANADGLPDIQLHSNSPTETDINIVDNVSKKYYPAP